MAKKSAVARDLKRQEMIKQHARKTRRTKGAR